MQSVFLVLGFLAPTLLALPTLPPQLAFNNTRVEQLGGSSSGSSSASSSGSSNSDLGGSCAQDYRWTASKFQREDCIIAVKEFFLRDAYPQNAEIFEFVPRMQRASSTKYRTVQTPRIISYGSCVVSIDLLNNIDNRMYLQGLPNLKRTNGYTFPTSDIATFDSLLVAARQIRDGCVLDSPATNPALGWMQMGQSQALGVFLWARDSWMDATFRPMFGSSGLLGASAPAMTRNGTDFSLAEDPLPIVSTVATGVSTVATS